MYFLFSSCLINTQITSENLSDLILKEQLNQSFNKEYADYFNNNRKQLLKIISTEQLMSNDSLFLLESYDFEEGRTYGIIWSSNDSVNFTYDKDNVEILKKPHQIFPETMLSMTENWNFENIDNYAKAYPFQSVDCIKVVLPTDKIYVITIDLLLE